MEKKLTDIINALVKDRKKYTSLTNKEKEHYFFIINRMLSKKYPEYSLKLNIKSMDKSLAMDMWFLKLKGVNPYDLFKWFWSKGSKVSNGLKREENIMLLKHYGISQKDLDFIVNHYGDELKEELKYLKKVL